MKKASVEIHDTLSLSGKEKVKFIKSVKPNLQGRLLELFNSLENTPSADFHEYMKKAYAASVFYAFSLVPDIRILLEKYDWSLKKLEADNSPLIWLPDFINKHF